MLGRGGLLAAFVAIVALLLLAAGGPSANAAGGAVIKAKFTDKGPFFSGDDTVKSGQKLKIENTTSPKQIGPHTFSIVQKKLLPKTNKEFQNCFGTGICTDIAEAHKFNPETGEVSKPVVSPGKDGWDKAFRRKPQRNGDSWYTDQKGQTFSQVVSARPGTKLFYICAIHPEMQGKIEVK